MQTRRDNATSARSDPSDRKQCLFGGRCREGMVLAKGGHGNTEKGML